MKHFTTITVATLLGLFSSATLAVTGNQSFGPMALDEGVSDSQIISQQPQRYRLDVPGTTTLNISSEHLASESSENVRIQGVLYNDSGEMISRDTDLRGHFLMQERVNPGTYILEVKGDAMGSPDEVSSRYNLHVSFQ